MSGSVQRRVVHLRSSTPCRIFPAGDVLVCVLECFLECLLEILHIVQSPYFLRHCDKAVMALSVRDFGLG